MAAHLGRELLVSRAGGVRFQLGLAGHQLGKAHVLGGLELKKEAVERGGKARDHVHGPEQDWGQPDDRRFELCVDDVGGRLELAFGFRERLDRLGVHDDAQVPRILGQLLDAAARLLQQRQHTFEPEPLGEGRALCRAAERGDLGDDGAQGVVNAGERQQLLLAEPERLEEFERPGLPLVGQAERGREAFERGVGVFDRAPGLFHGIAIGLEGRCRHAGRLGRRLDLFAKLHGVAGRLEGDDGAADRGRGHQPGRAERLQRAGRARRDRRLGADRVGDASEALGEGATNVHLAEDGLDLVGALGGAGGHPTEAARHDRVALVDPGLKLPDVGFDRDYKAVVDFGDRDLLRSDQVKALGVLL